MTRTVASQALDKAAQHEVAVGFEDHVNEVDDDDATDEAQAQKFYEEQVKIGIQAIHDTLGK